MTRPYEALTIEQVAAFPRPGAVVPGALGFTPDSAAVTYLYSAEGSLVRSLWRYDIATGERTVLAGPPPASTNEGELSREEEFRRERARLRELGVTAYQWARTAAKPLLLVPGGGRLFVSIDGGPLEELPGCDNAIDPHLSPDGTQVAFVRAGDLYVAAVPGGAPRRLTHDAGDGLTNGLAEFMAQEELDRDRGFWWDPTGRRIAFIRADERHIPVYPVVHQGKDVVDIEHHHYPFAGERNAVLRLGVVEVESGAVHWLDTGEDDDIYLARVAWRPDGVLTAQVLSRDQLDLRLLAFPGGEPTRLIDEHSEPWLNLSNDTRLLETGEILRSSEATGYRHLSLHAPDGRELRALTSGEWVVTRLVSLDERARVAYFSGTKDGVTERHLYAVSLDGGEVRRLTEGAGWHDCVVSADGTRFVDTHSTRERAARITLRRTSDGGEEAVLFEAPDVTAEQLGLAPPEIVTLPAADGATTLYGALYRPARLEPGKRYPLVVSVYGGPHAQRVIDDWSMTVDLRAQYLAQRGFAVLKVDNRGSANRGLAFEAPIHREPGRVEIEDQAAAVRWLAANYDFVDIGRVGIYGWSYGGYATLMAMLREPELFRVGVAGAPVTHWDGYDTAYTERYISTPQRNPEGYRESSVMAHVDALRGKLMLVHGMVDENVHFRHTARLMVALAAAQKEYDTLIFPEERHMPRDAKGLEYQERRVLGYLEQHL
ncbi:MAG: S9 family peptidase [Dehalococcoidia bacterium]|nr:S9 family peptidase [Dehalococcoidia bacterium]